jgi:hypothetical protein
MNRFSGEERITVVRAEYNHARSRIPSAPTAGLQRAFLKCRSSNPASFHKDG